MPAGQLSRQEMEQVIRSGGSVLHDGRLYTQIETLPTAADLAKGNPAQEQAAAQGLQAQIAALQADLAKLQQQAPAATPTVTPPEAALSSLSPEQSKALADAGFTTREQLRAASDEDLLKIPGIGDATLKKLRAELEG